MATQRAAIKGLLTANAAWNTLVDGGTYLREDVGRTGLSPEGASYDSNGKLKLTAVIAFSTATGKEIVRNSERRFFQVFFYHDSSFEQVALARRKAKDLLHQKQATSDAEGLNWIMWADDGPEFTADEMGGAAAAVSRYFVDYTRR
ncbi:MAG: hypothetical protein E6R03_17520 [Hyphomicrobiaceae bacterium]|nr:MAG: hypothetical protein E6R03_17520 [Hyphomicrobiaceae bacterium]